MTLFAGPVLLPDRVERGWLEVEAGRITGCGLEDPPSRPTAEGWLVPAPVNAHTHAADTALRDLPGKPEALGALVGPGGWKHRHLAAATPAALQDGIARLSGEAAAVGVALMVDFREGGAPGLATARGAALSCEVLWYGRPSRPLFDPEEAEEVLRLADGIGLSALRDLPSAVAEEWAEAAAAARKPLALHVSEAVHEPMDAVLALEPSLLVHGCVATRRELEDVASAGVPMTVCPRSNRHFGLRPPVRMMIDEGVQVALGTDNGMLQDGDVWAEARLLRAWERTLGEEEVLRMATYGGYAAAGRPPPTFTRGAPADWVVLGHETLQPTGHARPSLAPRPAETARSEA